MKTKVVWPAVLTLVIGFSPMALAASKDKDRAKNKENKAKPTHVSKEKDRGSAWHGQDWKSSKSTASAKPGQSVREVQYQGATTRPAGYASTQPSGAYTYRAVSGSDDYKYDYFSSHYGNKRYAARPTGTASATSKPADVMGYVPPDNSQNPFIYRRGS